MKNWALVWRKFYSQLFLGGHTVVKFGLKGGVPGYIFFFQFSYLNKRCSKIGATATRVFKIFVNLRGGME